MPKLSNHRKYRKIVLFLFVELQIIDHSSSQLEKREYVQLFLRTLKISHF
jgi:hypothetical protein